MFARLRSLPAYLIGECQKAVNLILIGVPTWGATSVPHGISPEEWWRLVAVIAGALVVFVTPNGRASSAQPIAD